MKILLIIPGINKKYNDNAYSYIHMHSQGAQIQVITSKLRETKGAGSDAPYENMDGIKIHRIYENFREQTSFPVKKYKQVYKIVTKFKPDLIFCSQQRNMKLAVKIKNDFNIPILLLVEFAYNSKNPFTLVGFLKGRLPVAASRLLVSTYWKWLRKHSSAIITCYHGDKKRLQRLSDKYTKTYYIPWPTYRSPSVTNVKKNVGRGIFIGALSKHKNIVEFSHTLPLIFGSTPVKEFYIVGSGDFQYIVQSLIEKFPDKIKYIPSIERNEALKLIASSFFAYAPMHYGGWGFLGDCWAVKTPIIATHNDYELINEMDSIVTSAQSTVNAINRLYSDKELYQTIQNSGYDRFEKYHTADAVGKQYMEVVKTVLESSG